MTGEAENKLSPFLTQMRAGLDRISLNDAIQALEKTGKMDPAVGIRIGVISESEINDVKIKYSVAEVLPDKRVNAHRHSGGDDSTTKENKGLEVYYGLRGSGVMSLGRRNKDGAVEWEHLSFGPGTSIDVPANIVHSLKAEESGIIFAFSGSPTHLDGTDRVMEENPAE